MKTIPFDLEKAKAGATVVTRDGRKVTEWHHFQSVDLYCIVAHIEGHSDISAHTLTGGSGRCRVFGSDLMILVEPKLRPWKPEELPLDAWYRKRGEACWGRVSSTFISGGIRYIRLFSRWNHCSDLLTDFEHSTDGGKQWLPCGVEE